MDAGTELLLEKRRNRSDAARRRWEDPEYRRKRGLVQSARRRERPTPQKKPKQRRERKERIQRAEGYWLLYLPGHRLANGGYVAEHALIWEAHHKRQLGEGWCVHHINGDKADNRPENLHAFSSNSEHTSFHTFARRLANTGWKACPNQKLPGALEKWLEPRQDSEEKAE